MIEPTLKPRIALAHRVAMGFRHLLEVGLIFPELGRSSAEEFEKHYNIEGFSEKYVYPYGLSAKAFEIKACLHFGPVLGLCQSRNRGRISLADEQLLRAYEAKKLSELNVINDDLVALNPQLKAVQRTRNHFVREDYFMLGTAYRFPPRDIDFFLNTHTDRDQEEQCQYIGGVNNSVMGFAKAKQHEAMMPGWIMSPKSIEVIDKMTRQCLANSNTSIKTTVFRP